MPRKYWYKPGGYETDHLIQGLDDKSLLLHMGVPSRALGFVPRMAADRPMAKEVEYWIDHLPYIYRPQQDKQDEKPELFGKGLIFYGPSGKRKTMTAAALLLRVIRMGIKNTDPSMRNKSWHGWCMGAFVDWQEASEMFRDAVGDEGGAAEAEELLREQMGPGGPATTRADFLIIDDVSRERNTEFNSGELQRILRRREDGGYPTILTTNHHPDTWVNVYGDVLAAFMRRAFISVPFE